MRGKVFYGQYCVDIPARVKYKMQQFQNWQVDVESGIEMGLFQVSTRRFEKFKIERLAVTELSQCKVGWMKLKDDLNEWMVFWIGLFSLYVIYATGFGFLLYWVLDVNSWIEGGRIVH